MTSRRIAVLFHREDRHYDPSRYIVHTFANCWRDDGHEVTYLYGVDRFVPADLVLVHVNVSVVPDEYLEFAGRYPIALNHRIRDIRKRTISTHLTRPGEGWEGPVIVKTDLNYGGAPERIFKRNWLERKWRPARRARRLWERLGGHDTIIADSLDYPIFDHVDEVPKAWLNHDSIVVEKFLPEVEEGRHHVRVYQFLGRRWTCMRVSSPSAVVKTAADARTEAVEPHPEVVAWRERLGMDYGKLDYVVCGGEVVLIDVNKTTGAAPPSRVSAYTGGNQLDTQRRYRAEGLYSYFDGLPE